MTTGNYARIGTSLVLAANMAACVSTGPKAGNPIIEDNTAPTAAPAAAAAPAKKRASVIWGDQECKTKLTAEVSDAGRLAKKAFKVATGVDDACVAVRLFDAAGKKPSALYFAQIDAPNCGVMSSSVAQAGTQIVGNVGGKILDWATGSGGTIVRSGSSAAKTGAKASSDNALVEAQKACNADAAAIKAILVSDTSRFAEAYSNANAGVKPVVKYFTDLDEGNKALVIPAVPSFTKK